MAGKPYVVVGMLCLSQEKAFDVLVVSENGYGKRSALDDYRITNRGGKGVKTINVTPKTGQLITIKNVTDQDDLMIINRSGIIIRLAIADLRVIGRATQGVRLINLKDDDSIAAVAKVEIEDDEAELEENLVNEGEITGETGEITPDSEGIVSAETEE